MTASKPEVLPCPFCGADPLEHAIEPHSHGGALKALGVPDHSGSHTIECGCGAGMIAEAKEAVRAMWNRRDMYSYVEPRAGVPEVAGYDVFESESCSHVLLLPKEMAKVRLRLSASATALIRLTDHEAIVRKIELEANQADYNYDCWKSEIEAERAVDKARIAEFEVLLSKCAPVMRAHAGASHMIEGFRPKRNQWDELVEAIDEAIARQGKDGEK